MKVQIDLKALERLLVSDIETLRRINVANYRGNQERVASNAYDRIEKLQDVLRHVAVEKFKSGKRSVNFDSSEVEKYIAKAIEQFEEVVGASAWCKTCPGVPKLEISGTSFSDPQSGCENLGHKVVKVKHVLDNEFLHKEE